MLGLSPTGMLPQINPLLGMSNPTLMNQNPAMAMFT